MGTRYRYHTPDGGPPNDGGPPGSEPSPGAMFAPPYPFGVPSPFGPPPFGMSPFGPPPGFPGPPPPGMMCFPTPGPPPPGPGPMMCFPNLGPPPPYTQSPWGAPIPVAGPTIPTKANERPPPGARVNGQIAKFGNQSGHIHSKNNTTFHVVLDGSKPFHWPGGTSHRMQVYTAASSMPIDEFIEQVGAISKAPYGTPREQIGVQECIEEGDGIYRAGPAFRLGDQAINFEQADGTVAPKTLEQLGWSSQRGEVGRGKPVTIAFLP